MLHEHFVIFRFSMEKRRSQMAISIEDSNGHYPHRQSSINSRHSNVNNSDHALSRKCSRYSHVSKRSSLGSNNRDQQGNTTTAEVMMASPMPPGKAVTADIERRLSQLSDSEVEQVVSVAIEEVVSRRNSNSSYHRRVSPQVSINVPAPAAPPGPGGATLLAPPTAEMLAQRRFSEVSAAIERHNSRRQAKRSQSVMYRQKRRATRRNSEIRRSPTDFDGGYRSSGGQLAVNNGAGGLGTNM